MFIQKVARVVSVVLLSLAVVVMIVMAAAENLGALFLALLAAGAFTAIIGTQGGKE